MDNQHKQISGYGDLSQKQIDLMNSGKELGKSLKAHIEMLESLSGLDQGAVSLAKTNLQQGLSWMTRAVSQPTEW